MKRFLILAILLVLALPIMAAPIVAGTEGASELTFGAIYDPGSGDSRTRYTNLIWTTVAQINESNYILFGIAGANKPDFSAFKIKAFSGNMILDKVLGLPEGMTVKLKFGIDDVAASNSPPSGYAYENLMAYDPGVQATAAVLATIYGVGIKFSANPGMSATDGFGVLKTSANMLANVYGTVGPFFLSGAYYSVGAIGNGKIGGEVQYNGTLGPVKLTVDVEDSYDLVLSQNIIGLATVINTEWLPWLSLDASTNYTNPTDNNSAGFNYFGIGIEARPDSKLARYGASLGFDFNMDPTVSEPIRSIDGSVWFKALGPGKVRVGYLWTKTGNGGGDYYAPAALPNGGLYFKYDMSW
jgi:hypothetical protein